MLLSDCAQLAELVEDSSASSTEKGITSSHLCVVGGQALERYLGDIHIVLLLKPPNWFLRYTFFRFLHSSPSHILLLEALTVDTTTANSSSLKASFFFFGSTTTLFFIITQVDLTIQIVFIELIERVPSLQFDLFKDGLFSYFLLFLFLGNDGRLSLLLLLLFLALSDDILDLGTFSLKSFLTL